MYLAPISSSRRHFFFSFLAIAGLWINQAQGQPASAGGGSVALASVLSLPDPVTTGALKRVRLFAEPLTPVGAEPSPEENAALAQVLQQYAVSRDVAELDAYVQARPNSPWRVSILTNLGLIKFDAGYFSQALADWTQAWNLGKTTPDLSREADAILVRALAEALKMNCRVGRVAEAKALLAELGDRPLSGLNATMIDVSRKAVVQMETMPKDCFKCGPFAVSSILAHNNQHTAETINVITAFPTTAQGTSLAQVMELANGPLGMQMQAAKRTSADAPILVPCVINWKLNHYGALLKEENGRYLMTDPTFGTSQWIGADAINQEASGYFLVPAGVLPEGWAAVDETEAGTIWGRGDCAVGDGNGTGPNAPKKGKGDGGCNGMAVWNIHHSMASLNLEDIPLFYDPPVGPSVNFRVNYSQLEQNQPTTIKFSNIGALWNLSWVSYLTFDSANARARMGEGGTELYTNYNSTTGTYSPDQSSHARLVRVADNNYERRESDGSKMIFNLPDGTGRLFATQIVDPEGNALTLSYDGNFRLVSLTDAVGQVTTLTHGSNTPGDPQFYLVKKVTDPFGRFTTLAYDASNRLTSVTDQIGMTSLFTYTASNIVDSLTTPYGTTTFDCGSATVPVKGVVAYAQVTEPDGAQYRVESLQYSTTAASDAAVPTGMPLLNQYLNYRNSYYWDAKAMLEAPGNYTKANLTHFLHLNASNIKANVIESEKDPLESRIWYFYQNQNPNGSIYTNEGMGAHPTHIGRVLDDGSTQLEKYEYNELGNITKSIDPLGRTTVYTYAANNIDLLKVEQVNDQGGLDLLGTYTWNSQHLPLTVKDASGGITTFTYNARGQTTSVTNALGQSATYTYNAQGYLLSTDGPLPGISDRSTFTYDAFGQLNTVTSGEGYTLDVDFDSFGRATKITYPDGTYEEITFTRLDPTQVRDRQGRTTTLAYNSGQQLVAVTDPLNRIVKFDWCQCGSLRRMIDPLGRVTTWNEDIQGRTTSKTYPDGTKETFAYEGASSRVARMTDTQGQVKAYAYNLDDTVASVSYLNTSVPTPGPSYVYDTNYPRVISMTDGQGVTTYRYGAVTGSSTGPNQIQETQTSWNGTTVAFTYDALGRVLSRTVNGVTQTLSRDAAGRTASLTNALGTFTYGYENASGRLTSVTLPNGQSVSASYLGSTGNHRLQELRNVQANATTLSQSNFTYNAASQVTGWTLQSSGNPTQAFVLNYDAGSQLISMTAPGRSYSFSYDPAGNLKTKTVNAATTTFTHNILNQVQAASPALGGDKTYQWDAENRLAAIFYTGTSLNTKFRYDGQGRCVEISERNGSTVTSLKRFVWAGLERCEERDAAGNVTRRFFPQGEQIAGANYFYSFDHLGSIREMTDSTGAIRARYEYDPYGVRTKVSGDLDASFGYTGHYYHAPSGLHLTLYRAYDAQTGQWLSRDPLGEEGGLNLYGYVANSPVNAVDPLGLWAGWAGGTGSWSAAATANGAMGVAFDGSSAGGYATWGGGMAAAIPDVSGGLEIGFSNAPSAKDAIENSGVTVSANIALGGKIGITWAEGTAESGEKFTSASLSLGFGSPSFGASTTVGGGKYSPLGGDPPPAPPAPAANAPNPGSTALPRPGPSPRPSAGGARDRFGNRLPWPPNPPKPGSLPKPGAKKNAPKQAPKKGAKPGPKGGACKAR